MDRNSHELRLQVNSDPRLLGVIRGVLQVWLEVLGFDADRRSEVVLAVDEACSNCIRHAYQGRIDEQVELVLSAAEKWIEVTVSDQGNPCPKECAEYRPLERRDAHEVTPGGLGVKLIYEVFDDVTFCPGGTGGNCVTMRLYKKPLGNDDED
jgi:anti-sigma regulatory factor (Ser/Thr protein kinase)